MERVGHSGSEERLVLGDLVPGLFEVVAEGWVGFEVGDVLVYEFAGVSYQAEVVEQGTVDAVQD